MSVVGSSGPTRGEGHAGRLDIDSESTLTIGMLTYVGSGWLHVLALFLGLRRGELLGLRWIDVNLENGTLRVAETLQRVDGDLHFVSGDQHPRTARRPAHRGLVRMITVDPVVARTRAILGAVSGLLGLVSVLGIAFHWAFYYLPLASLAQVDDRDMAAHAASTYGDDVLLVVALLMFLVGTLLAVVTAGVGLWRAHALQWWGAIGPVVWLGYVFAGPEARLAALLNLALLLPFVGVAQRLTPSKGTVPELELTAA
jgi:hypothetical protein